MAYHGVVWSTQNEYSTSGVLNQTKSSNPYWADWTHNCMEASKYSYGIKWFQIEKSADGGFHFVCSHDQNLPVRTCLEVWNIWAAYNQIEPRLDQNSSPASDGYKPRALSLSYPITVINRQFVTSSHLGIQVAVWVWYSYQMQIAETHCRSQWTNGEATRILPVRNRDNL